MSGPLPSKDGNLAETFDIEDGPLHVSVFTKAPARPMQFSMDWNPYFHRRLGELVGKMHSATRIYQPSEGIQKRKSWLNDMRYIGQSVPKRETVARWEFDEVVEWASSLETSRDTFGLVHTDINHSNYFGDDSCGVTVFVFDDARYHWFAYDLSAPMFYAVLSFHLPSMDATKQDWF